MAGINLGPNHALAVRLQQMQDQIDALSTRDVLQNANIVKGGLTVNGGNINITSGGSLIVTGTGTISLATGTFGANVINSTTTISAGGGISAGGTIYTPGTVQADAGVNSVGVYNNLVSSGAYKVQYVNVSGAMGYVPSSRRFKQDVETAPDASAAMLAMRIVTFRYIQAVEDLGDGAAVEWGVIAEEMHDLGLTWAVDYDSEGKPEGVKYERLVLATVPVIQDHEARLRAAGL